MPNPDRQNKPDIEKSEQELLNKSFDRQFDVLATHPVGYDGVALQRSNADNLAIKMTVVGTVTYIAKAAPGTAQSAASWQAQKVDETSGTVITWADGNAAFDNIASDLTLLTYS